MKIEIYGVEHKGRLKDEQLWLRVIQEVPDLSVYQVADTTFAGSAVSNELRHLYWFPPAAVRAGDWICLFTKNGKDATVARADGKTTHLFHWRLDRTVWNKGKDQAVLFEIAGWARKGV